MLNDLMDPTIVLLSDHAVTLPSKYFVYTYAPKKLRAVLVMILTIKMFPIFISHKAGCDSVSPSCAWQFTQNKALIFPKSTKQAGNQAAGGGGGGKLP